MDSFSQKLLGPSTSLRHQNNQLSKIWRQSKIQVFVHWLGRGKTIIRR